VASGALLRTLHAGSLQAGEALDRPLLFSADGRVVACASPRFVEPEPGHKVCRNKIRLWEVATGELLEAISVPFVKAAAFSPNGRTFAAGGGDYGSRGKGDTGSDIRVWDLATVTELTRFEGHRAYVSALAFSPDGRMLASGLVDSTVLLWDLAPSLRQARRHPALRPADSEVCWADLAGADARTAQASIWALLDTPQQAIAVLKERLRPARAAEPGELRRLIAELDSEQFEVRQAAFRNLRKFDTIAESALREALKGRPSLEQRRRIEQLIAELQGPINTDELRQGVRVIAILEHIGGADARRLLEKVAAGPAEARLTLEAAAALERLRRR
jgi:dipeptidyl aminopeptidase/acylaminoacyl peptidase